METRSDVLFTHSYFIGFDPKQRDAAQPYPPLATLYAASYLRELGFEVSLHDTMLADHEETLLDALAEHQPRLLVLYDDGFNYLTKMCLSRMREAAVEMIRMAHDFGIEVVLSSSDATDNASHYLEQGADYILVGEGEVTLGELVSKLLGGGEFDPRTIDGLLFLEDDEIVRTSQRVLMKDLDEFPRPAWDLVDVERYRAHWMAHHGRFQLNVSTTRGCPYRCNWCAKPIYGNRYTVRSPVSVAEEWAFLKSEFAPDRFWVCDDIFGLKPGWVERFRDELQARDAFVPYQIQARVDLMTEPVVRALAESGCVRVWLGAESGDQSILDAMDKGTTVDQIRRARTRLQAVGIEVAFFLQFGYPGETWPEIQRTLEMVRTLSPDDIGISVSYPLPGTAFYERVEAAMGTKRNWVDSDDLDPMYPSLYRPSFYRVLHRRVHAEFRVRKAIRSFGWLLRNLFRNPLMTGELDSTSVRRAIGSVAVGMKSALKLPWLDLRMRWLRRPWNGAQVIPVDPIEREDARPPSIDAVSSTIVEPTPHSVSHPVPHSVPGPSAVPRKPHPETVAVESGSGEPDGSN